MEEKIKIKGLQQKFSLLEMKTYLRLPSPWNALRIEKEN